MTHSAAIEQAFALARSGHHRSVSAILRQLPAEPRAEVAAWLATPAARRALILVCSDSWLAHN